VPAEDKLFGQKMRKRSWLLLDIFPCCQVLEGASPTQLFASRDAVSGRSWVEGGFVGCKAFNRNDERDKDERQNRKGSRCS
jgi:hypothetical protein